MELDPSPTPSDNEGGDGNIHHPMPMPPSEDCYAGSNSSSLTPGFQRLSTSSSGYTNSPTRMKGTRDQNGASSTYGASQPLFQADICARLRQLAEDGLRKRLHMPATFFADKLVTLSKGDPRDVLLLAQAHYEAGDYRRAVHIMERCGLLSPKEPLLVQVNGPHLQAYLLAAQCLAASEKYEDCIQHLEQVMPWEDDEDMASVVASLVAEASPSTTAHANTSHHPNPTSNGLGKGSLYQQPQSDQSSPSAEMNDITTLLGAMCCLRGKVYEYQDNRARAVAWLKQALRVDAYNVEALDFLVDRKLLSHKEEQALNTELKFAEGDEWLRALYSTRLCVHEPMGGEQQVEESRQDKFSQLEKYGLSENPEVLSAKAEVLYYQQDSMEAYKLARRVYQDDPFNSTCLPIYICAMADLGLKSELYYCAHQLVEAHSKSAISWFAVGAYYHTVGKHESAQRYFHKATKLDHRFAPAWIGFGNSFAAQDESDQAMSAYRTASRLFPASHLPLLYMGMEYLRTNNLSLAYHFLLAAKDLCCTDPLLHNELGVVLFRQGKFTEAVASFRHVLDLCKNLSSNTMEKWEGTIVNLGHCYRKQRAYPEAIKTYEKAVGLCPRRSSSFAALAFTFHLQGSLDVAIEYYHRALGLKPDDTFSSEMLLRALGDVFGSPGGVRSSTFGAFLDRPGSGYDADMLLADSAGEEEEDNMEGGDDDLSEEY